jgi:alkanesulfonate monooxygenase SsuD/methylene tetrahydromethanopterin reductase-like flavin-dependent oxidoreductase (luciferase family)
MEIGAAIFFTDYSVTPNELAVALEERGFDSLWVAELRTFRSPAGLPTLRAKRR